MMIAERVLQVGTPDGLVDVPIRLFAPVGKDTDWRCRTEIHWPDRIRAADAHGQDAFQALQLGMEMIGIHLYTSEYHEEGRLGFWDKWFGYGFPVPKTIRDLLFGDDEKYL